MEEQVNLSDIYRELKKIERAMVTKSEMEKALETIAILSNEDTMEQIIQSEEDIKSGNIKEINSTDDL